MTKQTSSVKLQQTYPMKLNQENLSQLSPNVAVPTYDRNKITEGIVHLGVGGFHRSHQALYIDELCQKHGVLDWAICGVGIMPGDAKMHQALKKQNALYTLVERSATVDRARVIGSLTRHIFGCEQPQTVIEAMAQKSVRIVTLTATEGGYCYNQGTGAFDEKNPGIQHDLKNPNSPQTIFGYLAQALKLRRAAGIAPFTVFSCDNLQENGKVARKTLLAFTELLDPALARWIEKEVAFPCCMVDRITPMTTDAERDFVRETFGIDDECPVVSEDFLQWVVEDKFCNGRPPLEKVGVQFTNDVVPFEKMKLRLLNATHSAMGYLGYLCGFRYIHEVAQSAEYSRYIRPMMDEEVTPVVGEVVGINLSEYKATVLSRFANEKIRDQVLRICMDGSAKMPKFILPSIQDQLENGGPIRRLTLCVAAWMRFLNGVDEAGQDIPLNDPMARELRAAACKGKDDPTPLLEMTEIFGDLGKSERFVGELKPLLKSLYGKGAWATLRNL